MRGRLCCASGCLRPSQRSRLQAQLPQRTLYDKLNYNFLRDIAPVASATLVRWSPAGPKPRRGTALAGSPADFGRLIADETEKWGKVIRAANIKPEWSSIPARYSITSVRRMAAITVLLGQSNDVR
jgi:hypothetical protein